MNEKNKAVFLDRDGTINVDRGYLFRIEDFEFLPGALDALRLIQEKGFLIVIVTNQSGIGRGFYGEEDFKLLNDWMIGKLKEEGIRLAGVYYCPHLPDAKIEKYRCECDCRKPGTGLFYRAAKELDIDLTESVVVGDKERDITLAGEVKGCRGFLLGPDLSLLDVAKEL